MHLNNLFRKKGCPGLLSKTYNLTDYNHLKDIDIGIEFSISNKNLNCIDDTKEKKFSYFLFNVKGTFIYICVKIIFYALFIFFTIFWLDDPYEKDNLALELPCKVKELELKLDGIKKNMVVEPLIR